MKTKSNPKKSKKGPHSKLGHFFCPNSGEDQKEKSSLQNVEMILSPTYLEGKAKFKSGSGPDPHLLMKLIPDPIPIREKTVRSGSVATSAINLTDNSIVCEQ